MIKRKKDKQMITRIADNHKNAGYISKHRKNFQKKFFTNKKKACKIKPLFFI